MLAPFEAFDLRSAMGEFRLIGYLPILLMFVVAGGFAASQVLATQLFGQRKQTPTKLMPYECGKDPVGTARERFSVKFYLIAMIFILFDIEVIFLIPWAVIFKKFAAAGSGFKLLVYVEMMIFIALLFIGYVYVWKKGAFEWGQKARKEAKAEARAIKDMEARKLEESKEIKKAA
jgi:NADH-quinone oxidoreductase subunit A